MTKCQSVTTIFKFANFATLPQQKFITNNKKFKVKKDMKSVNTVCTSTVMVARWSRLKSRIASMYSRIWTVIAPMLFVAFGLFGVNEEAWAGQAYVYAYSDPQDGGYVYVATSNSAPSAYSQKSHVASQGGFMSSGNKTFYLFYKCKDN